MNIGARVQFHHTGQILTNRQIFVKYSNTKFNANPSSGSRVAYGRTDRKTLRVVFSQYCHGAQGELQCADWTQQGAAVTAVQCASGSIAICRWTAAMCTAIQTADGTQSGDTKRKQYGRSTEGHEEMNSVRLLAVFMVVGWCSIEAEWWAETSLQTHSTTPEHTKIKPEHWPPWKHEKL